jgi:hypothetical protein
MEVAMKTALSILAIILSPLAFLWAISELSVGGNFDAGTVGVVAFLYCPLVLLLFLPGAALFVAGMVGLFRSPKHHL